MADTKPSPPPPSNFTAGHPKAALLFWFFGDFKCGVPLLIAIHDIYIKKKIGKNRDVKC